MLDTFTNADAQPNECVAIVPTLSCTSESDSDNSDSETTEQILFDSEPETDPPTAPSSTPSISTAPERGQLAMANTTVRTPISTMYKECIHELPTPTEAPLSVYRSTRYLEYNKHGEPYFKISKGAISISNLPPEEQNAAYNHIFAKVLPTNAFANGLMRVPDVCAGVVEHYGLHLSRLRFTRITIRHLALQHRTSAKLSYNSTMPPWRSAALRDKEKGVANAHLIAASSAFNKRAAQERDERGAIHLLDRCEQILKHDPGSRPADRRPATTETETTRWREGRRGWMGLQPDDVDWRIVGAGRNGDGGESGTAGKAKAALKKAFTKAANKAMGKTRRHSSVFRKARLSDRKMSLECG